ncbi:MAG: aminotransferase class V-fold PLP-dependent enzyme [Cephaloticoccus sp.]|nr:aminotransferase class V-fold PLP-dependent enzyme [Cephaloticoccus sp.]MCF7760942.1 aminotransferase class V-fold PLP-dependent enzyme [Cephaloticoccus sp.]
MNRKTFIRGLGIGALGAVTAPGVLASVPRATPIALPAYNPSEDAAFWRAVKSQYSLDPELHYMNTGGLGPAATPVLKFYTDTIWEHQRHGEHGHDTFHKARQVVADFFTAESSEICFTRNATEGNSIIAGGLDLREGDEVIFEDHAHPGGSGPWFLQQNRRGVVVKLFTPDPESVEGNLARIRELITPRTRVIQISHVTAPTGIVLPAAEIAELAQEHGIWFHIDGAQSAGMFPFKVIELGCDSYATSGHKWMGAPHETGVLFIRKERNHEVAPIAAGSYTGEIPSHLPGNLIYDHDASRHEYATRNAAAVVSVAAAVNFQKKVGRKRIAAHGRALAVQLHEGLLRIPTVEVLTPTRPELRASITTFRTPRIGYSELFSLLMKDHHFRCRPVSEQNLDATRISTHLFNTAEECEQLLAAIDSIVRKA